LWPPLPELKNENVILQPSFKMQEIIYNVTRDQDEKQYNLQVGQRVYVDLPAQAIMGFEMHEIESAPITS